MVAQIINIGDEILIGQIINTNAAWMASFLNQWGIHVEETQVRPEVDHRPQPAAGTTTAAWTLELGTVCTG